MRNASTPHSHIVGKDIIVLLNLLVIAKNKMEVFEQITSKTASS